MTTWYELVPINVYDMKVGRTFTADDLDDYPGVVLHGERMYDSLEEAIDWDDDTDIGTLGVDCWYFAAIDHISPYMDEQISEFGLASLLDVAILKAMVTRHQENLSKWFVPPLLTVWECKWWQSPYYGDTTDWESEHQFAGFLAVGCENIQRIEAPPTPTTTED